MTAIASIIAIIKLLAMLFMGMPADATLYEDGSWSTPTEQGCLTWGLCND